MSGNVTRGGFFTWTQEIPANGISQCRSSRFMEYTAHAICLR